jgi:hypothetical protein
MAYHPNNTPPKHIQNLLNSSFNNEFNNITVFENDFYEVVSKEHYYALYDKKESRYKYRDTYVTLRDCNEKLAVKIAEGLTYLITSNRN